MVARHGENREEAEDNSSFDFAVTGIFLYALVVELTIKGLWSYENRGAEPRHMHHVANVFRELQGATQMQIETIYEGNSKHYTRIL